MGRYDSANRDVEKHFEKKMPKKIKNLVSGALMDLHSGPMSKADMRDHGIKAWPGYSSALKQIRDWADDNISEVWYDMQSGYVEESEPKAWKDEETGEWVEPFWEDYVHFDRRDVMREVFGSLVTDGGL